MKVLTKEELNRANKDNLRILRSQHKTDAEKVQDILNNYLELNKRSLLRAKRKKAKPSIKPKIQSKPQQLELKFTTKKK